MELSSNWNALKQKIQKDTNHSNGSLKRKRPGENVPVAHKRVKGAYTKPSTSNNTPGMGQWMSKQSAQAEVPNETATHLPHGTQNLSKISVASKASQESSSATSISSVAAKKYIALDCEMVGIGPTPDIDSILARVSVVNYHGEILYDTYVLPPRGVKVTDYRTPISGIRPGHLRPQRAQASDHATTNGITQHIASDNDTHLLNTYGQPLASLPTVQSHLSTLLTDRILVGHALKNDFATLQLSHPVQARRDTARYLPFRALVGGRTPALRRLVRTVLGREIQQGEHSSVEDARAAMELYRRVRGEWESGPGGGRGRKKMEGENGKSGRNGVSKSGRGGEESEEDSEENGEEGSEDEEVDGELKARKARRRVRLKKNKRKKRTKRA
ncbi:MAG: 3'-5' exonuclease [Bathelium mastoideum]|nr:MAG: 3'-5' exonuclease [Bathelium mastoideum]